MNLALAFANSARSRSDKTAVYWGDAEFTYGDLLAQSQAVARQLREQFGVRPGDHVGLWLKNGPAFIPALLGVFHAGAVVAPINNFLKPQEVGFILNDAEIDVLITH